MKVKKKERRVPARCMRCGRRQTYCLSVKGESGKALGCFGCEVSGYTILTERQAKKKYTRVVKCGDSWRTFFVCDQQSFCVAQDRPRSEANWFAKMLTKALCRMVDKEAGNAT